MALVLLNPFSSTSSTPYLPTAPTPAPVAAHRSERPARAERTATSLGSATPTHTTVVYRNCAEVRAAGKAPLHRSDPGYSPALDRNGDGVACERGNS
jgi:hypothetical protein